MALEFPVRPVPAPIVLSAQVYTSEPAVDAVESDAVPIAPQDFIRFATLEDNEGNLGVAKVLEVGGEDNVAEEYGLLAPRWEATYASRSTSLPPEIACMA